MERNNLKGAYPLPPPGRKIGGFGEATLLNQKEIDDYKEYFKQWRKNNMTERMIERKYFNSYGRLFYRMDSNPEEDRYLWRISDREDEMGGVFMGSAKIYSLKEVIIKYKKIFKDYLKETYGE